MNYLPDENLEYIYRKHKQKELKNYVFHSNPLLLFVCFYLFCIQNSNLSVSCSFSLAVGELSCRVDKMYIFRDLN